MDKLKPNINKCISELLHKYDCVILPNFGGFLSNYKSASLSEDGKFITPPTKALSFNKNLSKNDGLLINYISEKNNIDYLSATKLVSNFVSEVFLDLDSGKKFVFDKIGEFNFDKSLNLIFEPNISENYLSDSFGLSTINFPVLESSLSKNIEQKGGLKNVLLSSSAKKVYLIIPILIFLSIVSVKTNLLNNLLINTSSISNVDIGLLDNNPPLSLVERKIDSMTKKENALFYKEPDFVVPKQYDSLVIQIMEESNVAEIIKPEITKVNKVKADKTDVSKTNLKKLDTKKAEVLRSA